MKHNILYFIIFLIFISLFSCKRADEDQDVLFQEDISNVILNVKQEDTSEILTYNYSLNSTKNPTIKLKDGKNYQVSVVFKNGNLDATSDIIETKDEHFLTFNFINTEVELTRTDPNTSTRTDGNKIGLQTQWKVVKAINGTTPQVIITLIHDAISVSEAKNGTTFGSTTGGETDAVSYFDIIQ